MTDKREMNKVAYQLQKACQVLSSVCDGARKQDGVGFSKPDACVGNLIAQVSPHEWTLETCAMVRDMLTKYTGQLSGFGISELPEVPQVEYDRPTAYQRLNVQVEGLKYRKVYNEFLEGQSSAQDLRAANSQVYCGVIANEWFRMFSPRDQSLIDNIKAIQTWQLRKWNRDLMCWEVAYQGLDSTGRNLLLTIINDYDFVVSDKDMEVLNQETEIEKLNKSQVHVYVEDEKIIFKIPFNRDAIADIKSRLQGRRWNPIEKVWTAPMNPINSEITMELALVWGWNLSKDFAKKAKKTIQTAEENIVGSQAVEADLEIPGLNPDYDLYPFQKAGVKYALKAKRVIIADEMGLGKTLQGSATVVSAKAFPCLVICPKAVKRQWAEEIRKFFPQQSVSLINGKTDWSANFLVINYDILKKNLEALKKISWKSVILDESHYIKNGKSQRSQAVIDLTKDVPYRIALTGTPVLNKPSELINQINFLNRMDTAFGGFWNFAHRYCNAQNTEYGWDLSGATNLDELARVLRGDCFVRREKKEVFKELPALQRTNIKCPISKSAVKKFAKMVKESQKKFEGRNDESARAEALVEIMRLKREAAQLKYDSGLEWIKNFLESGEKLVLFAHHKDIQDQLFKDLEAYNPASISGGDSSDKREKNVQKFWNDDSCQVIVCSLKAANVGLNLQKASNVAFFEFAWHSGDMDQAEARVHRIGSEATSINSYWLEGENTFDAFLIALIEAKREVAEAVSQGVKPNKKLLALAKLDPLKWFKKIVL